ncbi:MAG: GMC oxidoreductase [Patulibacter minatonensis]
MSHLRPTATRRRFLGRAALHAASGLGLATIAVPRAGAASGGAREDAVAGAAARAAGRAHWPVLVVGTGYGGAVSALRAAQAGHDVLMVEMGRAWNAPGRDGRVFCKTLQPDGRAMWFRDRTQAPISSVFGLPVVDQRIARYAGVLDRVDLGAMDVYAGRGVGGGSLVNGGMAVTPKRAYLEELLPGVDHAALFGTYFPRAHAELRSATISAAMLASTNAYRYARVAMKQAEAVGLRTVRIPQVYDLDYLAREQAGTVPRSALRQEVIYGNNHGKQSLDHTYLAEALGTGRVTIQALTKVDAIRREPDGTWVVALTQIDERGTVLGRREVGCRALVLGAGSLGSTELLLRARASGALPDLPASVGEGWGNNGNVMAARWVNDRVGVVQSTMPVAAIDNWADPVAPSLVEITPFPMGFETMMVGHLAVAKIPERATLRVDPATDRLTSDWQRDGNAGAIRALKRVMDPMNRRFRTAYRSDLFGGGRIFGDDFCYHPLGGCLLGKATDAYGRIPGHAGLYVNDGALLPGSVGVNPFVTITALAERNAAEALLPDLG